MDDGRLLLLSPALDFGGMELQLIELARAAAREGRRVIFLAGDGPLAGAAAEVAELELIDWTRRRVDTARRALDLGGAGCVAVMQADPALLHLIGPLAAAGAVHLCLHNRPGTFENWFNPDTLERFQRLVPRLHASGRVTFTASSTRHAIEHAQRLGLPRDAITPWFPGVDAPSASEALATGPIRRVVVVCRLSPEKLPMIGAGAELVAAGLSHGADVRLEVHGGGTAEGAARQMLTSRLPLDRFRLHGPTTRPMQALARADVVVNGGRAAIEALVAGRRVATPRISRGDSPGLGPAVERGSFADLKERNFIWRAAPEDPGELWRRIEAMSAEEVRAVRDTARRELSPEAVLEGHRAAIARTDRNAPAGPALLEGMVELSLALEDAHEEARRLADRLWSTGESPSGPAAS